jgi:hypothetical protein
MTVAAAHPSTILSEAQRTQLACASATALPLPPQQTAKSSSHPAIEFVQHAFAVGQPEVVDPTPQQRIEVLDGVT